MPLDLVRYVEAFSFFYIFFYVSFIYFGDRRYGEGLGGELYV